MRIINLLKLSVSLTEPDTLFDIINKPINIFIAKAQYKHLALRKRHTFEVLNHYLDPRTLFYNDTFFLNKNAGSYELRIKNAKICIRDDLLKLCKDFSNSARFSINKHGNIGYTIENKGKCLTVAYDSSVRMDSCEEGRDEQIFDFRPVKKLKCDAKYKQINNNIPYFRKVYSKNRRYIYNTKPLCKSRSGLMDSFHVYTKKICIPERNNDSVDSNYGYYNPYTKKNIPYLRTRTPLRFQGSDTSNYFIITK